MLQQVSRQRLPSSFARLLQQQTIAASLLCSTGATAAYSAAALPEPVEDELVSKASRVLEEIKEAGTLKVERQITTPQSATVGVLDQAQPVLNFCANNYLGLSNHPDVVAAAKQALDTHGFGLSSVRFICGTQDLHKQLEGRISAFHGSQDTILYPSCFDANAGLFEALLGPEDAVISDELNHASIIDGIRLCKAKRFSLDWLQQQCSQKKVFVLPAFETAPLADTDAAHKLANQAAAQDKQGLLQMVEKGQLWQFALKIFKQGHNCTDYPQWFTSQEAYGPVGWTKDYEPWFIADRTLMPFYDSVFRGYGWNKVTQVTNVHHQGFQFMVHPTGFLVHRQHSYSKAGTLYQASKKQYEQTVKEDKAKGEKDTSLAGTTHKFRNRVLDHLAEGSYQPVLDGGLTHCLGNLPWWREGQQLSKQQQQTPKQLQSKEQLTQEKGGKDVKDTAEASGGLNRKHMRVRVRVQQESSLAGPGTQAL